MNQPAHRSTPGAIVPFPVQSLPPQAASEADPDDGPGDYTVAYLKTLEPAQLADEVRDTLAAIAYLTADHPDELAEAQQRHRALCAAQRALAKESPHAI